MATAYGLKGGSFVRLSSNRQRSLPLSRNVPNNRLAALGDIDVLNSDLLLPLPELLQGQQPLLINRHEASGNIESFDFCVWRTGAMGS